MNTSENPSVPPSDASVSFARGVIARLAVWPALRIAVQENWGGPEAAQKRTWLASVIVDAFEEQVPTPDVFYIEDTLLQVMSDEFETVLDDGSAEGVAKDIVRIWDEVKIGKQELMLKFEEQADKIRGKKLEAQETVTEDDDEWEDDDCEEGCCSSEDEAAPELLPQREPEPKNVPEIDEDGFTMVKGKGKGRR